MTNRLYSIHDQLADKYSNLYESPNEAVAIRMFLHSLKKGDIADARDYVLYQVGEFDDITGQVLSVEPKMIKRGEEPKNE